MKLLILTATRGDSVWFEETYKSVRRLLDSGVDAHWIVVSSAEKIEELHGKYPVATFVVESSRGLYGALNDGINAACDWDWDWFSYINDDDAVCGGFESLCKGADSLCADILYGDVIYIDKNGDVIGTASVCRRAADLLPLFAQNIPPFTQQGSLVRRKWVEQLGGFDINLTHVSDSHFWVRALLAGATAAHVTGTVALYRNRPGQLSNNVDVMHRESALVASLAASSGCGTWVMRFAKMRFKISNISRILLRIKRVGFIASGRMFSEGCTIKKEGA